MRRVTVLFLLILAIWVAVLPAAAQNESERVLVLNVTGAVSPAMESYIERGIVSAEIDGYHAVVIALDTPGGYLDSTDVIVQSIRNARVPVIVYVSPAGAHAASAGAIITMSGHVAAMAPETRIGAASPVDSSGGDIPETMFNKITEDMTANVRALTERRGPEAVELAEAMILEAKAVSATEALAAGLIDVIATDIDDLLTQVEGLSVEVSGETIALHTVRAPIKTLEPTYLERFQLALTSNVYLISILLSLGPILILIEMRSPGGWVAGTAGLIALGVALYGLGQIPANLLGLGLLSLAFVLFVLEAKAPGIGLLAATGAATMFAGFLVLFNTAEGPDFARLSIPAALGLTLPTAVLFIGIIILAARSQRSRVLTGSEGLIGRKGVARNSFKPLGDQFGGTISVFGEIWRAQSSEAIRQGEPVVVESVENLTLHVNPQ